MRSGALLTLRLKRYALLGTLDGFDARRAMTFCGFRIADGDMAAVGMLTCVNVRRKTKECWSMCRVLIYTRRTALKQTKRTKYVVNEMG